MAKTLKTNNTDALIKILQYIGHQTRELSRDERQSVFQELIAEMKLKIQEFRKGKKPDDRTNRRLSYW